MAENPRGRDAEGAGLDRLFDDATHGFDVFGGGGLVACATFAHHVGAHRPVRHLGADVDAETTLVEDVEVFGERLPPPGDALRECCPGDVLDAFHELDQPLFASRVHGGEPDSAVAHHDRRDAVSGRRVQFVVPGDLAVVVGVAVDEAGCDDEPGGVDGSGGVTRRRRSDVDDHAVFDGDVADETVCSGAVDDGTAADLQVVQGWSLRMPIATTLDGPTTQRSVRESNRGPACVA